MNEETTRRLRQKDDVCSRIAGLRNRSDAAASDDLEALKKEFAEAGELPEEYAEIVDRKFAEVVKEAEAHLALVRENARNRTARMETLRNILVEIARIAALPSLLPEKKNIERLVSEWKKTSRDLPDIEPEQNAFEENRARTEQRLAAELAGREADIARMRELASALNAMAGMSENEIKVLRKENNRAYRELRDKYPADAPEFHALDAEYRKFDHVLNQKLTVFFQTLEMARWESYTLKLDMLKMLEDLQNAEEKALPAAAATLRKLREKWKTLGAVPHEKSDEINPRYLELTGKLQKRIDLFFKAQHARHQEAAAVKTGLCVKAEEFQDSTDWRNAADALKSLQAEWKTVPSAGKIQDEKLYARFREACNKFFDRRNAEFKVRQESYDAATAAKRALCEQAEKLGELPPAEGMRLAKKLRGDYSACAPAGRNERELYARFNAAMDEFFGKRRHEFADNAAARNELVDKLNALSGDLPLSELENQFNTLKSELFSCGMVPRNDLREQQERENAALKRAEKLLSEKRDARRSELFSNALRLGRALSDASATVFSGDFAAAKEELDRISPAELLDYPGLANDLKLLNAAASGDESASAKLKNGMEKNLAACEELLEKLESAAGRGSGADLAAELRDAMMGSFGGAIKKAAFDTAGWKKSFCRIGALPGEKRESIFRRIEEALNGMH